MRFTSHTRRVANRPHVCETCGRTIDRGETYDRQFTADGHVWVYKECVHCTALVARWNIWEFADTDGYGMDDLHEYRGQLSTIADARLWVQWKRRWRRYDGTLYPVPARTAEEAA